MIETYIDLYIHPYKSPSENSRRGGARLLRRGTFRRKSFPPEEARTSHSRGRGLSSPWGPEFASNSGSQGLGFRQPLERLLPAPSGGNLFRQTCRGGRRRGPLLRCPRPTPGIRCSARTPNPEGSEPAGPGHTHTHHHHTHTHAHTHTHTGTQSSSPGHP